VIVCVFELCLCAQVSSLRVCQCVWCVCVSMGVVFCDYMCVCVCVCVFGLCLLCVCVVCAFDSL